MKIAMIGQKGIPSRSGGVEIHVEQLATRLVKLGHDVTVYCRKGHCEENDCYLVPGVKIRIIPCIKTKHLEAISHSFFSTLHAVWHGAEVFHYHALGPTTMSFIPRLLGRKVVSTVHGLDWQRDKWGRFASLYLKFGEYAAAKHAHETISVSHTLLSYFDTKYQKRVHHIHNGVVPCEKKPANEITKQFGLEASSYILFLARLVPEKGLHYLIDAFKQIKTDKKLVIAGGNSHSGAYIDGVMEMAKDDPRIIFTGFVRGDTLEELYSNCYAYVLPSDVEGMPISLLEAMSYGACCVISDITENTSVLCENGVCFLKGNVSDLRSKLEDLLEHPEMRELFGEKARAYVSKTFCWDRAAAMTSDVYKLLFRCEKKVIIEKENISSIL